jgi:hypothetical protein
MTMSKVAVALSWTPSSVPARIRCPVEETGRNSVTPSTMPRRMTVRRSMHGP